MNYNFVIALRSCPSLKWISRRTLTSRKNITSKKERNMAFKIIPDASILIDLTLQRSDDYEDLVLIYQKIVDNTFQGFLTTSIIHINAYWLTKALDIDNTKKVLI